MFNPGPPPINTHLIFDAFARLEVSSCSLTRLPKFHAIHAASQVKASSLVYTQIHIDLCLTAGTDLGLFTASKSYQSIIPLIARQWATFRMAEVILEHEPAPSETERYRCYFCLKSFARKAHMLRHQQQHAFQNSFLCNFCSKSFQRSDVLRAHQYRCKKRGDQPVPEGQTKGRKRSSCASCVKLRMKCDQGTPCGRCKEMGKECVRGNISRSCGLRDRIVEFVDSTAVRTTDVYLAESREAIPIQHLLNTPPGGDLPGRFPIRAVSFDAVEDEDENNTRMNIEDSSEASRWSGDFDPYDPYIGGDTTFESLFGDLESLAFGQYLMQSEYLPYSANVGSITTDTASQALESRAMEIKLNLHATAAILNRLPETQYTTALASDIDRISGAEINTLISLYFQHYHKHCPILHRPSFQPTRVPLPLLLSVLALGGMYSPDSARVQWTRSLLDVMEAYTFSLPGLRDGYKNSVELVVASNDDILQMQLELLQGAYLMIITQYFSGNLAAKRRARRQRYARVLEIARSFKLPTAQHDLFMAIPDEAAFQVWIRQETRIRQMNLMLAFDAAMAIFNNMPTRIHFSELDLQLPCDPQYFELSSYSEMIVQFAFPKVRPKFVEAFQKLFIPSSDRDDTPGHDSLNCWDMLFLIHALYTHVWHQTFSNPLLRSSSTTLHAPNSVIDPLKTAVRNWKTIWDNIHADPQRDAITEMGFETSADSYWKLTKLLVHRFDPKSTSTGEMGSVTPTSAPLADLDFMPLETDCDSQGAHLRKILRQAG